MAALRDRKKERRSAGLYICEGEKVLAEALTEGVQLSDVVCAASCVDRLRPLLAGAEQAGARLLSVPDGLLGVISDVETPQGVVFSVKIPAPVQDASPADLLICDEIRDPGNLGTIIRTADAFGVGGIYLCGDCADVYAPKTVRACMGSIFRVPIFRGSAAEAGAFCREHGLALYCAKPRGDAVALSGGLMPHTAVAIGNEAHGVSAALEAESCGALYVDMSGRAESLNAAVCASVVLWHMQCVRRGRQTGEGVE